MARFRFSLAVALERAQADQEAGEAALAEAHAGVRAARIKLQAHDGRIDAARRRIALDQAWLRGESGGGGSARAVTDRMSLIAARRAQEGALRAARRQFVAEVCFAEQQVRLRREELDESVRRVESLQRLREQELAAWHQQQRRAEEQVQEDLVMVKAASGCQAGLCGRAVEEGAS